MVSVMNSVFASRRALCVFAILMVAIIEFKMAAAGPTTAKPILCPSDIVVRTKTAMELCEKDAAGLMAGPPGSIQIPAIAELARRRRQVPAAEEAAEEQDPDTVMCVFGKLKVAYPQLTAVEKSCAPPAAPPVKGPTTTSASANKGKQDEDIRIATCIADKMKAICH